MRPRETTAQRSHRVFDDRQRLMHEEFSTRESSSLPVNPHLPH